MTQEELNEQLLEACNNKNWKRAKELIEKGADVTARDKHGWAAIHFAVMNYKNPKNIKYLIEKGADINIKDDYNRTALHLASCVENNYRLEVAKFLIENGVDVNAKDNDDHTALYLAVFVRNLEIFKLLIDSGANIKDDNTVSEIVTAKRNLTYQKMAEYLEGLGK